MSKKFFERDSSIVAKELLGCELVRTLNSKELRARIVETEAYFDESDPASRACQGGDLRETMKMEAGTILVYGVHNNWLINFVTDKNEIASAVLIRAVEPLNFEGNCDGPGKLTKALGINKEFHKQSIIGNKRIRIENPREYISNSNNMKKGRREKSGVINLGINNKKTKISKKKNLGSFKIGRSGRIGVKKDLDIPMRFYIKGNKHVSR